MYMDEGKYIKALEDLDKCYRHCKSGCMQDGDLLLVQEKIDEIKEIIFEYKPLRLTPNTADKHYRQYM